MNLKAIFSTLSKHGFNYCDVTLSGTGSGSFNWSEGHGGRGDALKLELDAGNTTTLTLYRSQIILDEGRVVRYKPLTRVVQVTASVEAVLNAMLALPYDKLEVDE